MNMLFCSDTGTIDTVHGFYMHALIGKKLKMRYMALTWEWALAWVQPARSTQCHNASLGLFVSSRSSHLFSGR